MRVSSARFVAALALAAAPLVAGDERVVRREFAVSEGGKLSIRTDSGDIDIRSGSSNRVTVEARVRSHGKKGQKATDRASSFSIDIAQRGNEIVVRGVDRDKRESWFNWFHDGVDVRYTVSIPRRFNVDAGTRGGDVSIGDAHGAVVIQTSGGDLRAGQIEGMFNARTSGGDIRLTSASGPAAVYTSGGDISIGRVTTDFKGETSGGDIKVQNCGGRAMLRTSGGDISIGAANGSLDASTSGGSVDVRFVAQPTSDSKLSTSGGDVVVWLPRNVRLLLDAKTSGGEVVTDVPVKVSGRIEDDELHGTLNGGGPRLQLRSSAGRIEIRGR